MISERQSCDSRLWIITIVINALGFLLVIVYGGTICFHPHLRVHDGAGLVPLWLGQLLG